MEFMMESTPKIWDKQASERPERWSCLTVHMDIIFKERVYLLVILKEGTLSESDLRREMVLVL